MSHQSQVLWLSHFKGGLSLQMNQLTGTLPTEMGNMTQLCKLLCTHCLNSWMNFVFCMNFCLCLLWFLDFYLESVNCSMSHHLQVLWLSYFKGGLDISSNQLMGALPTEIGNMNELCKLLCTHCLNSWMNFVFFMIICISLLWI